MQTLQCPLHAAQLKRSLQRKLNAVPGNCVRCPPQAIQNTAYSIHQDISDSAWSPILRWIFGPLAPICRFISLWRWECACSMPSIGCRGSASSPVSVALTVAGRLFGGDTRIMSRFVRERRHGGDYLFQIALLKKTAAKKQEEERDKTLKKGAW
jgi:hypothetical protein